MPADPQLAARRACSQHQKKPRALACLYLDEEARLLGCAEVRLPYRFPLGILTREGMRKREPLTLCTPHRPSRARRGQRYWRFILDSSILKVMPKTTSIILGETVESFIQEKVASGQYASASEVIREAMRAFQREDEKERAVLSELDRALKSPRAKADVFKRLRKRRGPRTS